MLNKNTKLKALAVRQTVFRNPDRRFVGRIDRRLVANFDWTLLILMILVILIGLINLYSATHHQEEHYSLFTRQLIWIFVGLVLMVFSFLINYQVFRNIAYGVMIGALLLLFVTLILGFATHGARRWLNLGFFSFQPSEVAKLALIITLAKYLSELRSVGHDLNLKDLSWAMGIVFAPALLVLFQPDLGTAILITLIGMTMILFVGVRRNILIVSGAVLLIVGFTYGYFLMPEYQMDRVKTLLRPEDDPTGKGYQISQAIIAIGSGRTLGCGFRQGTQNQLGFIPEKHNDFIFAVLGEEWGMLGGLVTLILFFALIVWGVSISMRAKDHFGALLGIGMTAFIFWHVVINIGMVMGMLPVVGVPLPFISYGRTSLLTMMMAVGFLLNISGRRYLF